LLASESNRRKLELGKFLATVRAAAAGAGAISQIGHAPTLKYNETPIIPFSCTGADIFWVSGVLLLRGPLK